MKLRQRSRVKNLGSQELRRIQALSLKKSQYKRLKPSLIPNLLKVKGLRSNPSKHHHNLNPRLQLMIYPSRVRQSWNLQRVMMKKKSRFSLKQNQRSQGRSKPRSRLLQMKMSLLLREKSNRQRSNPQRGGRKARLVMRVKVVKLRKLRNWLLKNQGRIPKELKEFQMKPQRLALIISLPSTINLQLKTKTNSQNLYLKLEPDSLLKLELMVTEFPTI